MIAVMTRDQWEYVADNVIECQGSDSLLTKIEEAIDHTPLPDAKYISIRLTPEEEELAMPSIELLDGGVL